MQRDVRFRRLSVHSSLLEFLAKSKSGFSTSEISRRLGLPKSSTYLIVETLEQRGFLQKNRQNGRYYLGLKLITLSRHAIENLDLREEAKPFLRSLMQQTHLIAHMASPRWRRGDDHRKG